MEYFIWSFEHGAWWKEARNGYSTDVKYAGKYYFAEAVQIVISANEHCPKGKPNEAMLPVF